MEFSEKVRELMKDAGITQKELSKKSGVSEASLSRYLSGSLKPRMDIIINVSKALGVSPGELTGDINAIKQDSYAETISIVARNRNKLTDEEKTEIIKVLFGGK